MVQGINAGQGIGTITKIGSTEDGRNIYQVTNSEGKKAGKISVAAKDCDSFEKAYNDIVEAAPKIQEWTEKHSSPKEMERRKTCAKIVQWGTTLGAMAYPMLKGFKGKWGWLKGLGWTTLGFIGGGLTGTFLAGKIVTPPGAAKLVSATRKLSQIDAQPVE